MELFLCILKTQLGSLNVSPTCKRGKNPNPSELGWKGRRGRKIMLDLYNFKLNTDIDIDSEMSPDVLKSLTSILYLLY